MEIPEPAAAESFWTLPNHQFSDPLLLRNPRAYPCGFISVAFRRRPPFFVYLSRSIDTFLLSPRNFAETKDRVRGASFCLGKPRRFLNFCPWSFGDGEEEREEREGRRRTLLCVSTDERSIIIQCRRCKTSSRRRFLPSWTRKLFLLPSRNELFRGCYRRLCELYVCRCFFLRSNAPRNHFQGKMWRMRERENIALLVFTMRWMLKCHRSNLSELSRNACIYFIFLIFLYLYVFYN